MRLTCPCSRSVVLPTEHLQLLCRFGSDRTLSGCAQDDSFDVVLDKTLLDALCCSEQAVMLVPKMLEHLQRVLNAPNGLYIIISFSLFDAKASFDHE
eukprot:SAG31_NODE_22092_length_534_cov_0.850575_2_plen_96_part_01